MLRKRTLALLGVLVAVIAVAADEPDGEKIDRRKSFIEGPLEKLLVAPADPNPAGKLREYVSKVGVENPTKKLLANGTAPPAQAPVEAVILPENLDVRKGRAERPIERLVSESLPTQPATTSDNSENPSVEPGKVRWHDDFAAACAASRDSGKPVLLFQMMGNLDDRFC